VQMPSPIDIREGRHSDVEEADIRASEADEDQIAHLRRGAGSRV